jgi:GNAT superfamily N-acetyltransferase
MALRTPIVTMGKAVDTDAAAITTLRTAVANRLTREHGVGHWSAAVSEKGVLRGIQTSHVVVARSESTIIGTLRLVTKKPWAIDPAYFVAVRRPLYLVDMAVLPEVQRQGIGRLLCEEARRVARAWPAGSIRLDAYDHAAGAGEFYAKCGFREMGRVTYRRVPLIYFEVVL